MERKFVAKVESQGVDSDPGSVLVYRLGEQVSVVATAEKSGDVEIILDKAATFALAEALKKAS
jgi:hypothetical protein